MSSSREWDFFLGHTKQSARGHTETFVLHNLYKPLKAKGHRVFYDHVSLAGRKIEECLRAAAQCHVHVLILDDCTPGSEWVLKELEESIKAGNPIVSVYRKDKFSWAEVGKDYWKSKLSNDERHKAIIKAIFTVPSVAFDADPAVEEIWTQLTIKIVEDVLASAKATPPPNPSVYSLPAPSPPTPLPAQPAVVNRVEEAPQDVGDRHSRVLLDDGSEYVGALRNGKKHGRGTLKRPDGSVYTGEFKDDLMDGWGLYTWTDGRVYKGQWSASRFQGYGVMTWEDGRRYDGYYKEDKKWGVGTFLWPDGRKHLSIWVDGKQHGVGVFTTANGVSRKGVWADGCRTEWLGESVPKANVDDITPPELRFTPPSVPEEVFAFAAKK